MVNLTLLGCGGNVPLPNRFLSSLFMNFNGRKILEIVAKAHKFL